MDWDTYLGHVQADGERLAGAAGAGLNDAVPNCPGWSVSDLVYHVGEVHRHKTFVVQRRSLEPPAGWEEPQRPADADLLAWYRRGLGELLETLSTSDPSQPVWTWAENDQTVGFWYRRMAHETLVHRVDAEQAHGGVGLVDEELATDGIDEVVTTFLSDAPSWATIEADTGVVRLQVPQRSWGLQFARMSGTSPVSGTTYTDLPAVLLRDGAAPDASVAGSGVELDLWLWGRGPIERLSVIGDRELAARLRTVAAEATQ